MILVRAHSMSTQRRILSLMRWHSCRSKRRQYDGYSGTDRGPADTDFEDAIRNAISIGGDSDTIAAIAGGLAEALFGIPDHLAADAMNRLPDDLRAVVIAMYAVAPETSSRQRRIFDLP